MDTNVRVIEAIKCITDIGLDMAKATDYIAELEQAIDDLRYTVNELERKLESAEKACANEADSCDKIEAKLVETLRVNENLRVARNEECTKYEKVCGELTEMIEQLEAATELNNYLSNKIKELESQPAEGGKHRG